LLLALCTVGLLGCGQPSRFAGGSGYGVGVPRAAITFSGHAQARRGTSQGFAGEPREYGGPVHVSSEAPPRSGAAPR
jgi:hypothetical protein